MATNPTPTPWAVHPDAPFEVVMNDGDVCPLVATVNASDVTPDQAAADAAFIVKAVNSHDALVKALKFYASEWQPNGDGDSETPGLSRSWVEPTDALHDDAGRIAREALSQAA